MSAQLAIDFAALARSSDPETSRAAAARVDGETLACRVLAELRAHGPGTTHELAARLNLSLVTVSPRLRPLASRHLVREAGKKEGRIVWEAMP